MTQPQPDRHLEPRGPVELIVCYLGCGAAKYVPPQPYYHPDGDILGGHDDSRVGMIVLEPRSIPDIAIAHGMDTPGGFDTTANPRSSVGPTIDSVCSLTRACGLRRLLPAISPRRKYPCNLDDAAMRATQCAPCARPRTPTS